ncbi:hypothetical protein [Silvimonas soli]|uniref:hypothetical protein n=1 Tax=Silvimonas soli TaxID=2980100 RepID=UPI0024B3539B|nr:hypothetical protein [Silvimonas soli]
MHYHLVIPHGIWPDVDLQSQIIANLQLPALATLIARGQRLPGKKQQWHAWLSERFGLRSLPVAPLTLGVDFPGAEPGYWLRADPVHLHVGRDQLSLQDGRSFDITQADADALISSLNGLFKDDGYEFFAPTPQRWYLRLPLDPQLRCTPIDAVIGRNIDPFLPKGPDALQWHRALNEIQMLFYTNPVNDQREARGEPSINSIWLWGGGDWPLPRKPVVPEQWVLGDDPVLQALVKAGQGKTAALPAHASELPRHDAMVVLDVLGDELIANDPHGWRTTWQKLESNWFAPLLEQLRAGRLDSVALSFPEIGLAVEANRSLRWRFWRRPRLPW